MIKQNGYLENLLVSKTHFNRLVPIQMYGQSKLDSSEFSGKKMLVFMVAI